MRSSPEQRRYDPISEGSELSESTVPAKAGTSCRKAALMITLEQLRSQYREQILVLAEKHGAENIRVFGSVARGEQREDSDVDFLIHMKRGCGLWEMAGMWGEMETVLPFEFDLVAEDRLRPEMAQRILVEAVPL